MRYGDIVRVLPSKGLLIAPKLLQPLGIFDQSRAWGMWVEDAGCPEYEPVDETERMTQVFPQLVISPIHPLLWTSVFRVSMRLEDEAGAAHRAARALAKHGVNMLSMECAPSGYGQANFSAVAECPDLTRDCQSDFSDFWEERRHDEQPDKRLDDRCELSRTIGKRTLDRIARLQAQIEGEDDRELRFLWEWGRAHGRQPWELDEEDVQSDPARREAWRRHWTEPVQIRAQRVLAVARIWSYVFDRESQPHRVRAIRFRYSRRENLLRTEGGTDLETLVQTIWPQNFSLRLTHALASFSALDGLVRLRFLSGDFVKKHVKQVELKYRFPPPPDETATDVPAALTSSKGLLWSVLDELSEKQNVNFLRVYNSVGESQYDVQDLSLQQEHGVIRGILSTMGALAGEEDLRHGLALIEHPILDHGDPMPKLHAYPPGTLLVSYPIDHPRELDFKGCIRDYMEECGFAGVVELSDNRSRDSADGSDLLENPFDGSLIVMDAASPTKWDHWRLTWLIAQHSVESGETPHDRTMVLLVDTVREDLDRWKVDFQSEYGRLTDGRVKCKVREFKSNLSANDLRQEIRSALEDAKRAPEGDHKTGY